MKMLNPEDIIGVISCIIGTIFIALMMIFVIFFPGNPPSTPLLSYPLIYFCSGSATLVLGILAVSKGSKIGIGGIALGAFLLWGTIRLSYRL